MGERYSLFQNFQTGSGAHTASFSMGTDIRSRGYSGRSMKVSSHIHLVPKLSVNGATPLLLPYAFMAWKGTPLPLPLPLYICVTGINLAAVKYLKGVLDSVTFLDLFQHK
jgi:glutamine synthetase type III